MLALPGLLLLVFVDYMRPQVHFPALQALMPLHLSAALAAGGLALDLRLAVSRLRAAPHLVFTLLFFAWCIVTVALRAPDALLPRVTILLIPLTIYLITAHAVQTFRMLEVLCGLLLAISLVLSGLGIYQGFAPRECHRQVLRNGESTLVADGRPCANRLDCEREGEPGADYSCEHVGLFGTSSTGGRVRWMGTMQDPNELSLALGITIPFAFAFLQRRRTAARMVLVAATALAAGLCAILTQSRGGQLIFLTVLGAYFVRQVGVVRGGMVGLVLALPLIIFGGRSGGEADESTGERTWLWWFGLHLFTASPLTGVGSGQFLEYHVLTAHNSFVLSLAELGLPGLFLFTGILWMAVKIPVEVLRSQTAPPVAHTWALALLASMAGMIIGIEFLSFIYKDSFWLFMGLTGVLYQAMKRHDPRFEVEFGKRDLWLLGLTNVALIVTHIGFTGLKLGW